jgi:hypothetical protein
MIRKIILYITCITVFIGCKTTKNLTSDLTVNPKLSVKQILKNHNKQRANFETLQAKVKIEYTQNTQSISQPVTIRILKDQVIWINALLNVVRLKITPNKIQFYNKLDQTYMDSDFSVISNLLGTEFTFDQLQKLLFGELIHDFKPNRYIKQRDLKSYALSLKRPSVLEVMYKINPSYFKLNSQTIQNRSNNQVLQVNYKAYQSVSGLVLPKAIHVLAQQNLEQVEVKLNIKSLSLNSPLRFPFKVPSGYKLIQP